MDELDEIVGEFLAESAENLGRLDRDLAALVADPGSPELLASVFRTLHSIKGTSGCLAFDRLEELAHAGETLLARLRDRELALTPSIAGVLRELIAAVRALLARIAITGTDTGLDLRRVLAAVRAAADTDPDGPTPIERATRTLPRIGEPSGRALDELPELDRLGTELRTRLPRTRMQPLEQVWSRFPRLVRTLGDRCGKQVRLQLAGGETELDRGVLDAIRDPLTHLVRNAVDHGIEPAAQRLAAGKPAHGTLRLRADAIAGRVVVEVADDGAGIDLRAVGSDALARGLVTGDQLARMSADQLRELIFRPGLSTAPRVTRVSGRGVGMDVVKTNVERIGGSVEIHSEPGIGTSCRLWVPMLAERRPA
jgi:two-component system chemotaxis sensor kinase CheA